MSGSKKRISNRQLSEASNVGSLFSQFCETCDVAFTFLVTEHRFKPPCFEQNIPEFLARYDRAAIRICIYLEYPGMPWGVIERCHAGKWRRYSLERELCKEDPSIKSVKLSEWAAAIIYLGGALQRNASILRAEVK